MSQFFVIGLHANARCGKDTAANILTNGLFRGKNVRSYAFAKPFKDALAIMLNMSVEQLYGDKKLEVDPVYGVTPRFALTSIGTEWGRNTINPEIWIIRAKQEINKAIADGCDGIIITDVRFPNEAQAIYEFNSPDDGIIATVVHITAPGVVREHDMYQHESEQTLPVNETLDVEVINPYKLVGDEAALVEYDRALTSGLMRRGIY